MVARHVPSFCEEVKRVRLLALEPLPNADDIGEHGEGDQEVGKWSALPEVAPCEPSLLLLDPFQFLQFAQTPPPRSLPSPSRAPQLTVNRGVKRGYCRFRARAGPAFGSLGL